MLGFEQVTHMPMAQASFPGQLLPFLFWGGDSVPLLK